MQLPENIRALRRERGLTQERLAEAIGVSSAAVSKWESGASTPEVTMLAQLADYFELSIDRLVGYQLRTHREEDEISHIRELITSHRYQEAQLASQALLRRYPNSFNTVVAALDVHFLFGLQAQDKPALREGLALVDRALALPQPPGKPAKSREELLFIKGELHESLGECEQAIRYYEQISFDHERDIPIGKCYLDMKRFDAALPLLSKGLIGRILSSFNAVCGMITCLAELHRLQEAEALIDWYLRLLDGLDATPTSFIWKLRAMLLLAQAEIAWDTQRPQEAEAAIRQAVACALRFDKSPDYSIRSLRFYHGPDRAVADSMGFSAMEGLRRAIDDNNDNRYQALRLMLDRAEEEAHEQHKP